ncbi:hypothetical protein AB4Z01_23640 [Inquilinus sp. YAF38]|uniref:hypothetical protein n=1 Tax=Inquilinus sp. YAF38 TaxID=3233084 RepID=UPI003F91C14D
MTDSQTMTVKRLKKELAGLDDEMRVCVGPTNEGGFAQATSTQRLPSSDGKILVIRYSKLR